MTKVVLCCGTGGVGKTTAAAALGVAWTLAGKRVIVMTIDPARRLADALGLVGLDNTPRPVALEGVAVPEGASLHALMLDRKATFDESVRSLSEDPESADRLMENRYYRAVSTRLTGSHEYMATEKLFELLTSGDYDVIVVDTPPSQHAIEFFHAPERVQRLFEGPVVRRLVNPGRGLTGGGTRRVLKWILNLVGRQVVDDIGEFFRLMSSASQGFAQHGMEVGRVLRSSQTHLLLITSPARAARDGALRFLEHAQSDGLHVNGFVLNRYVSASGTTEATWQRPPPADMPASQWDPWLAALRVQAERQDAIATRHALAAQELSEAAEGAPVWALPYIADGLRSADGLADLAAHLPPGAEPTLGGSDRAGPT